LEFVEEAPLSYQLTVSGKTFFFCHAGVRPGVPMAEQKMADLLWIRNDYYEHYHGDTIVVTGHTPTPCVDGGFKPIMWDDHIMLDTGSYLPGGHITCMDVLTREYWQSDED
jgi:serine/threonine protein phosphatase 1